jgi:MoaA/NifB/PqqE/SkfB family radical SAM enzyme
MQWRHWFKPYPELDYIQLEVSTYCNASCAYCPRTVAGAAWNNLHMTPATLKPLLRHLPNISYIHLQGWGEPLLNPHFFDLIELVKSHGCRCGTTTNGVLLNNKVAEKLITSGIDLVAISMAGAGASHERFRQGAPLSKVLDGIKTLARTKIQLPNTPPAIHIAYMLLRDGIPEIRRLPELLAGLAVAEIVVSTLDHIPHPSLATQTIPRNTPEWTQLTGQLAEVKQQLAKTGTQLIWNSSPVSATSRTCSERIDRALVIAADGGIHPCVFANLPELATGKKRKSFGTLQHDGFDKTWWSDNYIHFRNSFGGNALDELCLGCPKRLIEK